MISLPYRYHGVVKKLLKPNLRVDETLNCFLKLDLRSLRKEISVRQKIRGDFKKSRWQSEYASLHPSEEDLQQYELVDQGTNGRFKLKATKRKESGDGFEILHYSLEKNQFKCNRSLCEVRCQKCPAANCVHLLTCTCTYYGMRGYCKHSHVINMLSATPGPDNEHSYLQANYSMGLEENILPLESRTTMLEVKCVISKKTVLFYPADPHNDIRRSTMIFNQAWHTLQVVARVVKTTDFIHWQPTAPNC